MEEIIGQVERLTFRNPDNGWPVDRLKEPKKPELPTVVGMMTSVRLGETVGCNRHWSYSPGSCFHRWNLLERNRLLKQETSSYWAF